MEGLVIEASGARRQFSSLALLSAIWGRVLGLIRTIWSRSAPDGGRCSSGNGSTGTCDGAVFCACAAMRRETRRRRLIASFLGAHVCSNQLGRKEDGFDMSPAQ